MENAKIERMKKLKTGLMVEHLRAYLEASGYVIVSFKADEPEYGHIDLRVVTRPVVAK